AYINGNTLYARVTNKNPSGAGTVTTNHALGTVSNNTNYTLEIEAHDSGTRLYFYPKGGARSAGYSYTSQLPQLGDMRFIAYGRSSSTSSSSLTYLDNLKVATGGIAIGIDAPQERYMHTDHLGSVVAVTDNQGRILERFSYDAWGKRRNLDGTDDSAYDLQGQGLLPALSTHHGFTGHEMLDEMSLVHMNGRLYDPLIARFVNADPNIDGLYTTQGLNSYTYVHNNPLNKTDPSGYFSLGSVFKSIKKAVSNIHSAHKKIHKAASVPGNKIIRAVGPEVASAVVAIASIYFCGPGAAACAAAFSAASSSRIATAYGASSTEALRAGAISGAITYASVAAADAIGGATTTSVGGGVYTQSGGQAAAAIALHGLRGGVVSIASGGDFRSGFLAGGFGAAGGVSGLTKGETIQGYVAAGVIGGTGSAIGGGKFAIGAVVAIVGKRHNDGGHPTDEDLNPFKIIGVEVKKAFFHMLAIEDRRFAVQMGVVGSAQAFIGGGGDVGVYFGVNEAGKIETGTYATGTGLISGSIGADGGIIVSWGNIYTNQLRGDTVGFYGGLDTPVLDIMYGQELIPGFGGRVHNITVTGGVEPSAGGLIGGESNLNKTAISPW
ncbi:RHS repeat-associated core domain-containing protein, partial [Halopseudomonas sabulinigri]|uniref:RHS repeat-associated core domain-containing protein n=1 Tax=Halopseudomonas sabulinigri TaxID=472181 RepID=UPI0033424BD4